MDLEKQHLVELLNGIHPVYNVDGNVYSYRFSEIARYSFDNFDHKLVMIEFTLPSCFDEVIEVKSVANKLTEKLRETVGKDLFLISSERNVVNRIIIYVDFRDIVKDTKKKKRDIQRVEGEHHHQQQQLNNNVTTKLTTGVPNLLPREALKSKLCDNLIFNKVRDFLGYYARNKDKHDRDLNGSSYLSQKIELSNCGFQLSTEELTTLYVEFCKEAGGFTAEEIEDDLDYRGKSIIANRIIEYNQAITNGSHEERFAVAKNWLMEYVSAKAETLKSDNIL